MTWWNDVFQHNVLYRVWARPHPGISNCLSGAIKSWKKKLYWSNLNDSTSVFTGSVQMLTIPRGEKVPIPLPYIMSQLYMKPCDRPVKFCKQPIQWQHVGLAGQIKDKIMKCETSDNYDTYRWGILHDQMFLLIRWSRCSKTLILHYINKHGTIKRIKVQFVEEVKWILERFAHLLC